MAVRDLTQLVSAAAAERPGRPAVVEADGRQVTWAELDDEVRQVAAGLVAEGIVAGTRVLLALGNRLELVTTYLAVLRAQAVAVPVNPTASVDELTRMLADSGSRLAVGDQATATPLREAVGIVAAAAAGESTDLAPELAARAVSPRLAVVGAVPGPGELGYDDLCRQRVGALPPLQDPEKLAALLYTSGTSGLPRAAMLTHRALVANLEQTAALDPPAMHGDDVVLGVLPLFHVYGLNAVLGSVLRHRARLVLVDRFDPEDTLDLVHDQACSVLPLAPSVLGHWMLREHLRERLGSVRLVLSGSAPLGRDVVSRFAELTGLTVQQGYGLTEAAPVVTSTLASTHPLPGSVGTPVPGLELRVVDHHGEPVHGEDPGEIEIRGANLFSGYWPDGAGGPGQDGWWATGDIGLLAASGELFLIDRLRELVVVSGFNVYPREVEDVLREVPGVLESAVIGVPDESAGEAVVAYVVARDADPAVLARAVRDHCAVRLAAFKRPARIEVVERLPVTATGKVQKGRLRHHERRRTSGLIP